MLCLTNYNMDCKSYIIFNTIKKKAKKLQMKNKAVHKYNAAADI